MKINRLWAFLACLAGLTILALILAFVVVPRSTEGRKNLAALTQKTASTSDSPAEGIAVHGHWTIEVRNPDGSLADHREFENALTTTGAWQLAAILSRQKSVGGWLIHAGAAIPSESPFMEPPSSGLDCWVVEPAYLVTQPWVFNNMTVSSPTSGTDAYKVVLSGTAIAQRNGKINQVTTSIWTLSPSVAPSGTYSGGGQDFTSKAIADVNVTSGQQIAFTVVISFS
jgi:autotransporter translocation and assembly factor TamB